MLSETQENAVYTFPILYQQKDYNSIFVEVFKYINRLYSNQIYPFLFSLVEITIVVWSFYNYNINYIFTWPMKKKIVLNTRIVKTISLLIKLGFLSNHYIGQWSRSTNKENIQYENTIPTIKE